MCPAEWSATIRQQVVVLKDWENTENSQNQTKGRNACLESLSKSDFYLFIYFKGWFFISSEKKMLQCTLKMISDWDTSVKKQLHQNVCQCYLGEKKIKRIIFCFLQNKERKRFRCFVWCRSHEPKKKHPVIYRHLVFNGGNAVRTIVGVVLFLQLKKNRALKLWYKTCWSVWNALFFYCIPLELIYFIFVHFLKKKEKNTVFFLETHLKSLQNR